jgi:hypothetical protein
MKNTCHPQHGTHLPACRASRPVEMTDDLPHSRRHPSRCIIMQERNVRYSAPIRAIGVKRHDGSDPVACVVSPGWPDCSSGSSSQLPGSRRRAGGVKLERPQPRSGEDERAGRRRTADDHGQRGRGPFVLVYEGSWLSPAWLAEWSRKHPFGVRPACRLAP